MIKLHLGCGWRNFGKDWTHIDGGTYDHLDYNSLVNLEFPDNTIDLIYSSHAIEYFDREEIIEVFKEWKRVLKPEGVLRLAVPDFEAMINLYHENIIKLENMLGPLYGKMKMGQETIYHKTVYDFASLSTLLIKCGFRNVRLYDWRETAHKHFDDHSQAYIPHMDKENGTLISLNVESIK